MSWNGEIDPNCKYPAAVEVNDELDRLGYRYGFVTLHEFPHSSLPDYRPMAAWFEAAPITRDPAHITFVVNAHMSPGRAAADIPLGRFAGWTNPERNAWNTVRLYAEFAGTLKPQQDLAAQNAAVAEYQAIRRSRRGA